jgi:hypothetical protein
MNGLSVCKGSRERIAAVATGSRLPRASILLVTFSLMVGAGVGTASAEQVISSSGPLTNIYLGEGLACQVDHAGDTTHEFYPPSSAAGSCGTFLSTGGESYGLSVAYAPVSQTAVTGSGTDADPFKVVTVVDAGSTGLRVTQTDSYVVGNEFYRSAVQITNSTNSDIPAVLYHAADCYLQESDSGYGFYDSSSGGIYCSANPDNSPKDRIEGFVPQGAGSSNYLETFYSSVFSAANGSPYPSTCDCETLQDNGAGLSWVIPVAANSSVTRSLLSTFSPTGQTPSQIEIAPPAVESAVGSSYTFSATVTEAGAPQNGIPVTFTVTGANAQTGSSPSNEAGVASFTYKGEHAGTDHIVASFVDKLGETHVSNEVTKIWTGSAPSTSTPPTATTAAPPPPPPPPPTPKTKVLPFKLSVPALGKTVNVEVVSGVVFVKLPTGAAASLAAPPASAFESLSKGVGFIPLAEARQIPVGSTLDTTAGVARLTTATAKPGAMQFGNFGGGFFTILQNRAQRGLTNLNIANAASPKQVCATIGKKAQTASKHLSSKVLGRLNGTAHGKFTTRGQYSAATVRGTIWNVTNRCDGTLTRVSRGVVAVRDFLRRRTITLHAGQQYLAKAP